MAALRPSKASAINRIENFLIGNELSLVLNLEGHATITPQTIEGWEQTLTIMNNGPDRNIQITRNGAVVTVTQPASSPLKNGPPPCVGIIVPDTFKSLKIVSTSLGHVTGSAFPSATIIQACGHAHIDLASHSCFAQIQGEADLRVELHPQKLSQSGRFVERLPDLVLASFSSFPARLGGTIDRAFIYSAREISLLPRTTIGELDLFGTGDREVERQRKLVQAAQNLTQTALNSTELGNAKTVAELLLKAFGEKRASLARQSRDGVHVGGFAGGKIAKQQPR